MKKRWVFALSSILALPFALASIGSTLNNVWQKILSVGNLSFLGAQGLVPITRILIWLLLFTVFFAVTSIISSKRILPFTKGQAMVVAGVVATIAAIFMPAHVLLATGAGWATAVALILIGGPLVGFGYLLYTNPGPGEETKSTVLIKIAVCLLLFWILSAMKNVVAFAS